MAVGGGLPSPAQTIDQNTTTNPNQQIPVIQMTAASTPPSPPGVTIPQWILQLIPVIALLAGAVMVFAQQRADVEQLKESLIEIKTIQSTQTQQFVSKQIFELKMNETEKTQTQMNQRFDKLESLLNGLYDRLPAKQK